MMFNALMTRDLEVRLPVQRQVRRTCYEFEVPLDGRSPAELRDDCMEQMYAAIESMHLRDDYVNQCIDRARYRVGDGKFVMCIVL